MVACIAVSSVTAMAQTGGNKKVAVSFNAAFPEASNVSWSQRKSFVVVSFTDCKQPVQAYYDFDGNRIAVTRNVRFDNLTMPALTAVQKKYIGYDFIGGVEMEHSEDGHSYYVSMQKDSRRVILRVSMDGDLKVFKTMKVTNVHLPAFAMTEDMMK
jgi:hypothetical protein